MSKVKLELKTKSHGQLLDFATKHKQAMVGNGNFAAPSPAPAIYDAALAAYDANLKQITEGELSLNVLREQRETLRSAMENELNARGSYVASQSKGEIAQILSAGFEVQAEATVTTSIAKPTNVVATMGDNPGEIDLGCNAVTKGQGYVFEMRDHSDTAASGAWGQAKFGTRSSMTYTGLASGSKHAFRIKALGPNELESPWSDEAICMAP